MNRYIDKFLIKYRHPRPQKPQLSTHKHREVTYGTKEEPTPEEDTSPALENEDTKRIQGIFGSLFYHLRAVDNKLLVGLSAIGAQQAAATQLTNKSINKLLDYSATYPTNEILYCSREMMLCAHSDAGFHNESKCRIRAGAHIFCPKNEPMPKWNGPVLTLYHIIKFFMSSAFEAELGAVFITPQEISLMRKT